MIKRVELQHKVKYLGKEYSVKLYNDSDFNTAFKTLQYPSGIMSNTENALIATNLNDYNNIFIENGYRTIHFYSDENDSSEKRESFIYDTFSKYNANKVFIFLVSKGDITLDKINTILNELREDCEYYISLIIDSKANKNSVRIVIGT